MHVSTEFVLVLLLLTIPTVCVIVLYQCFHEEVLAWSATPPPVVAAPPPLPWPGVAPWEPSHFGISIKNWPNYPRDQDYPLVSSSGSSLTPLSLPPLLLSIAFHSKHSWVCVSSSSYAQGLQCLALPHLGKANGRLVIRWHREYICNFGIFPSRVELLR